MKWNAIAAIAAAAMLCVLSAISGETRAQGAITPGETLTGTISPAGDSDSWTFSATAGDAIIVRIGEITQTGSFAPRLRLFDPSNGLVGTSFSTIGAEVTVSAAATGTYTAIVDDSSGSGATGTYRITLAKTGSAITVTAGDQGGPLTNGALHTGTIDVGDLDVWTVSAVAGESIVVRMGEAVGGSALTPQLRLYSPTGAFLSSSFSTIGAEVSAVAPTTGLYIVVAGDATGSFAGSGDYRITLAKTGSPVTVSAGDEGGPMTNGAMHTGTISVGDLDVWTVDALAGEAIVVRVGETTGGSSLTPQLRLYSPAGPILDESFSTIGAEVAATAPATGTYLVVVGDASGSFSGSGSYRLTLAKTGSPVTVSAGDQGGPMVNGAVHTGTIDIGDLDVWTVNAFAGQSIVVRMAETTGGSSLTPGLRLYSPSGALLSSNFSTIGAEVTAVAPADGTYLVVAGDTSGSFSGSGDYQLMLAKTGDPVVVSPGDQGGPLTNGAMHTGTISVGDIDVWTVNAVAGESIVVRMGEIVGGSTLTPWLRLYSPTGALLASNFSTIGAEVTAVAPSTGTYIVLAGDASGSFSGFGDYRITLAKTGSAVTVSPGDEGGPMTNGAMHTGTIDVGDLDVWTVSATAGDAIVVRMGEITGGSTLTPQLRIYSPTGALLDSSFSTIGAEVTVTAPATGTYIVVAGDASGSFSGSGTYRLTLAKTGAAVTVSPGDEGGPLTNGSINGVIDTGDLDVFTIGAVTGDHLVITMTESVGGSSLVPWLRLYSPSGALLGSSFGAATAQISVTTTTTGTFLLVAGDAAGSFSGTGGYGLTLAGASGLPQSGPLNVDASIDKKYDGLTDGLLIVRYLFGLTGTTLTANAVDGTATRSDPNAIKTYLDSIVTSLDVDLNGRAEGLFDGLLIIRYMFGLRGDTLTSNALGEGATRTNATDIQNYIQSLMP